MKVKVAIIGAGPAGLSLAHALGVRGVKDVLLLESESDVGGLCRSRQVDGSPLDIGGGHFLDVRRPQVVKFLFSFMPECEWSRFERDSRIFVHSQMIGSPFEANIWQLDECHQRKYLKDIAEAGCNRGEPKPELFVDWIYWKLGRGIAEDYMLPYNRKMFGENLNALGTYWLEKLPDVSYEDTLRSCREHKAYAIQPGHAEFLYPKRYGYGEVWRRMGDALGERLVCGCPAKTLDVASRKINDDIEADVVVNTAPWTSFQSIAGVSPAASGKIAQLRWTSVDVDYVASDPGTPAHWIYIPSEEYREHRWLARCNFCAGSRGYWKETRAERNAPQEPGAFRHASPYAYPLNTIGKNEAMADFLSELSSHGVFGLGRWGEWQHYNSDVVVERAMRLAEEIGRSLA